MMPIVLAVAAVAIIGVSNAVTWALTKAYNPCHHYAPRHTAPVADDPTVTRPDAIEVTS